ncbi:MAG: Asp-tRNA(Asn)/Glu-tRNA(Gln) amidotransferase subunit GatC [bacterium]|nr:Asp-tRNA(Asn)/Glu-tRNA(Gln) amidotransferase subunit GatC [bacterium]
MDKEKVLSLAKLARIELKDEEAENLTREFSAILDYVGEVKAATGDQQTNKLENVGLSNVFREDGEPHQSGLYTEKILAQAPAREGGHIKVKKIL